MPLRPGSAAGATLLPLLAVAVAALAASPAAARAQRVVRRPGAAASGGAIADQVPVTVALTVGGKSVKASGAGRCTHTAAGSIYGVAAAMWSVQLSPPGRAAESVSLTVWRPVAGGAAQLAFSGVGGHEISTVKGGRAVGSGRVTVTPHAPGAAFAIDGRSGDGTAIRGTVDCARLTAAIAEGG